MKTYRFTLKLLTAFGTPLVGDSLFGQFCWAVVHRYGEKRLTELLKGYTEQKPFIVVSDVFPTGYLPLPVLPSKLWEKGTEDDRKKLKKKTWIEVDHYSQAVNTWQKVAKADSEILQKTKQNQPHNTLSRQTMTTGTGEFAPYAMPQIWFSAKKEEKTAPLFDLYLVSDGRLSLDEISQCLKDIGQTGFGRDASIGLGKFELVGEPQAVQFETKNANACLTLANTAPQNLGLHKENSFYQLHTRFGRHGSLKALGSSPFKKPIILAKTSAVFAVENWDKPFLGNGLSDVSIVQKEAVHQGYAPVVPVYVNFEADYSDK
ncbi:TPA: type III-A CRISPR-associated RAMP protein Csm4 [Mannheimia haemolytica]